MLKEYLLELEKCLIHAKNPILTYLDQGPSFDENKFALELESLHLNLSPDLADLYNWKSGLLQQPWGFNYNLFFDGTHIHYTETVPVYHIIVERDREFYENRLLPIILNPFTGYEDPVLIDLNKKSSTYGGIYYFSNIILDIADEPILIYDSLESMISTIIECYHQKIYTIDANGELFCETKKMNDMAKKMNAKSPYWNVLLE
jgi:hypothetical protein